MCSSPEKLGFHDDDDDGDGDNDLVNNAIDDKDIGFDDYKTGYFVMSRI